MKRRCPAVLDHAQASTLAVRTGEHCPESGWWYPVQARRAGLPMATSRFVGQGSVLPAVGGSPSLWLPTRS
ncbi:hypothetical protein QFZ30_003825 [Arthrobacter pascens]|nr:hypothetical protein [Arthrobacter pascens]